MAKRRFGMNHVLLLGVILFGIMFIGAMFDLWDGLSFIGGREYGNFIVDDVNILVNVPHSFNDTAHTSSFYSERGWTEYYSDGYRFENRLFSKGSIRDRAVWSEACLDLTLSDYERVTILYSYLVQGGGNRIREEQIMYFTPLTNASCNANEDICFVEGARVVDIEYDENNNNYFINDATGSGYLSGDEDLCWRFETVRMDTGIAEMIHSLSVVSVDLVPFPTPEPEPDPDPDPQPEICSEKAGFFKQIWCFITSFFKNLW